MTDEELKNLMKKVEEQNTERMMSQMDSVLWSQVTANRVECLKVAVDLQMHIGIPINEKSTSVVDKTLQLADKLYKWVNKKDEDK